MITPRLQNSDFKLYILGPELSEHDPASSANAIRLEALAQRLESTIETRSASFEGMKLRVAFASGTAPASLEAERLEGELISAVGDIKRLGVIAKKKFGTPGVSQDSRKSPSPRV